MIVVVTSEYNTTRAIPCDRVTTPYTFGNSPFTRARQYTQRSYFVHFRISWCTQFHVPRFRSMRADTIGLDKAKEAAEEAGSVTRDEKREQSREEPIRAKH